MMKILFLYYMEPELKKHWNDGLKAALGILDSHKKFSVVFHNLYFNKKPSWHLYDFVLGWGSFGSPVDKELVKHRDLKIPFGLCIGGNAFPVRTDFTYDVLFYETSWFVPQVKRSNCFWHKNAVRAFGINSEIFYKYREEDWSKYSLRDNYTLYDYISVGSFSNWKRHHLIIDKPGNKLCIGQIQQNNLSESMQIIENLLKSGVAVSDMVDPYKLALIYNLAETVHIPANIIGGGERVAWEAKACGCDVEIENDNPKLQSLLDEDVRDEHWYYRQLKKGILSCLK